MKRICEYLREHAMRVIGFKKKMKLLTNKQQEKLYYFFTENLEYKSTRYKNYCKVRDHCHNTDEYRGALHSICNLKYNEPKEIGIIFHSRYNYHYDFIIKELAKEFEGQFTCLGKNGDEITKTVFYRLLFVDSPRFMLPSIKSC